MDSREGSTDLVRCDCDALAPEYRVLLDNSPVMKSFKLFDEPFRFFLNLSVTRKLSAFYCSEKKSDYSRMSLTESYNQFSKTFWRLFSMFVLNKRMVVFLILLSPLMAESSPTQRVRHLRHALRGDRLCDKPQVMDHPHDLECRRFRSRRDIHQMNLREGENTTMCDYRVCVDKNVNRMPQDIHRVFCVESGCRCQEEGIFRCTQLTDTMEVWYGVTTGKTTMDRVEVEVGCVCAAKHGYHVDNFNPSISVDK